MAASAPPKAVTAPSRPAAAPPKPRKKRDWKWWVFAVSSVLGLAVILTLLLLPADSRSDLTGALEGYRGGEGAGLLIAFVGLLAIAYAQAYTLVKRTGDPILSRRLGGAGFWLSLHIAMSVLGVVFVLIHAGFPYRVRLVPLNARAFAGLATVLLITVTASGFFGRYLYRRIPVFKKQFRYWQQIHAVMTILLFLFAVLHAINAEE